MIRLAAVAVWMTIRWAILMLIRGVLWLIAGQHRHSLARPVPPWWIRRELDDDVNGDHR